MNSLPRHLTRQLALQGAAYFIALSVAWPYFVLRGAELPWGPTSVAVGVIGLTIASATRQAWWWRAIHAIFAPCAWLVSGLAIPPGWFLAGFIALLLVYRGAVVGRVPLYLSNPATIKALADIVATRRATRFLDLGAGIGSVVVGLATRLPEARIDGVENAPATWLVGKLRTAPLRNCRWHLTNIWKADLADYDVVYAFLSPYPMEALWAKAKNEMRPDCLLVSNSFAVPDVLPDEIVDVGDARGTQLYCYRMPHRSAG